MRKEDLGENVQPRREPGSHDLLFASAVSASAELGRAVLLADISRLMRESEDQTGWHALQADYKHRLLPAMKNRGDSFRRWCNEWMNLQVQGRNQDVLDLPYVPSVMTALKRYLNLQ